MCGIVGYVGRAEAAPILLDGLRRLEYRGYDSAGVAIVNGKQIETRKCAGRIANLAKLMTEKPPSGQYRHQPHALGYPWESDRRKRASAL